MAKQKKEKEQENKTTTHTSSSGSTKGGRGGSFGTQQTPSVPSKPLSYPSQGDMSVAATFESINTLKQFAQAQRGLNAYASDEKKHSAYVKSIPRPAVPEDASPILQQYVSGLRAEKNNGYTNRINQYWTFDQKMNFGYLYDMDPKSAQDYAISVNNVIAKTLDRPKLEKIGSQATQSVGSAVVHNAAALGISTMLPMAESLDKIIQYQTWGRTVERPYIIPWDYSREVRSATRDHLNKYSLDEDIPVLGGKGLGDLYDLGYGVAESWLSANTIGRAFGVAGKLAGTLAVTANTFARSTTSAMDAARRNGADGRQSLSFGITMGLLEAAADAMPVEELLTMTPKTTVKEFMADALKHGALEGLTETLSEGLGQMAEYHILGDYSSFAQRRSSYIRRGAAPEEASRRALRDSFYDLGFTMLAGTAAGTVAAGTQSVLEDRLAAIRACDADLKENEFSISEIFQLRRDLQYISQSYERFTPEGQQRWQAMEDRYNELMAKYERSRKAQDEKQTHLAAYRQELKQHDSQLPFIPELHRMAVEMSTPDGWGDDFRYSDYLSAAEKTDWEADASAENRSDDFSQNAIEKTQTEDYNRDEKSAYRLRFMSNRDQFFRNLDAVEPMTGYQDIACHADAYGFAAQDPETGELLEDLSPRELAYRILDSGKYNGGPIRLLACSSGAVEDGAAQQLADLLHVPVLAPTDTLFTSMDGYIAVAATRSEAGQMMIDMAKNNLKFTMKGWKLYEPGEE